MYLCVVFCVPCSARSDGRQGMEKGLAAVFPCRRHRHFASVYFVPFMIAAVRSKVRHAQHDKVRLVARLLGSVVDKQCVLGATRMLSKTIPHPKVSSRSSDRLVSSLSLLRIASSGHKATALSLLDSYQQPVSMCLNLCSILVRREKKKREKKRARRKSRSLVAFRNVSRFGLLGCWGIETLETMLLSHGYFQVFVRSYAWVSSRSLDER